MKKTVLISLANNFGAKTTKVVADALGKFYLNINDFVEYSLAKTPNALVNADYEYFLNLERKAICEALSYEDTIYYCDYDLYINNLKFFKKCSIIYIALSEKQLKCLNEDNQVITLIAFKDRDKILKNNYFVESANVDLADFASQIIKKVGEIK